MTGWRRSGFLSSFILHLRIQSLLFFPSSSSCQMTSQTPRPLSSTWAPRSRRPRTWCWRSSPCSTTRAPRCSGWGSRESRSSLWPTRTRYDWRRGTECVCVCAQKFCAYMCTNQTTSLLFCLPAEPWEPADVPASCPAKAESRRWVTFPVLYGL